MGIEEKLKLLPAEPGVYLLKGARGEVLYVGKAASLKSRVRSHFQTSARDPKARRLLEEVADVETVVTPSEREALILEDTLIKRRRPRYNVRLRDDKRYPYLKLTAERYPRLTVTRRVEDDARSGARYFGPYTDVGAMRQAKKTVQEIFRVRTCSLTIREPPVRERPCLDHYIGLCDAPCVDRIPEVDYREQAEEAALFLQGRYQRLLPQIKGEMLEAAGALEFERAARLRDRVQALTRLPDAPTLVPQGGDLDAIGLHLAGGACAVQVLFVRDGVLAGRDRVSVETADADDPREILTAFVKQYYARAAFIPREILLPHEIDPEERELVESWLSERRGRRVHLKTPKRGPKARLMETAVRNAELALKEAQARAPQGPDESARAAEELAELLGLPEPPARVEGFDVSNIGGQEAVASLVVFVGGSPAKSDYRRFRMRCPGPDDVAMIAEAVRRRMRRAQEGDPKFLPFPDLILIDGGKGQLGVARAALLELGLSRIPAVALAKEHEELFVPGRSRALVPPKDSPALKLLMRVRDEAHRFALAYHQRLRGKRALLSELDRVPGVGPARRRALFHHFGSAKRLREASLEELRRVPGLPQAVARRVFEALRRRS